MVITKPCMAVLLEVISISLSIFCSNGVMGSSSSPPPPSQFPAMFVFGDSLVDVGNNNYLDSLAKSNYLPYGIDFDGGPTGRFCNGKTIIDFLGELLGLPPLPAFAATFSTAGDILSGVNYASAAAGILEDSGKNLVYFKPAGAEFFEHLEPVEEADGWQGIEAALHRLGLRKFLLAGVGPLGCIPNQLATGLAPPGECLTFVNEMVQVFNMQLKSLVDQLNTNPTDHTVFVYGNTYGAFTQILNNPDSYGFVATDRGCCGVGKNRGLITCLPIVTPCSNRDEYIFWDAYHPTQAFNKIVAQKAYAGQPSDCYPINVQQMAEI
ncbi:unnamed protein product [Dovyalis caffra]|uniref:GDSL esterase/lipase n=1 Tax=Dovyalis caffra TaxID=77055 RepID=A0AAV1R3K0_9ROSI|nr:unnamed protein product [Dovyalis caffra]